jgi:hypothetical protein
MIEEHEHQLSLFGSLAPLGEDELDDAEYRAKDRAWAALVEVFEDRKTEDGLNYQLLGSRIGRSRKQVQRWLSSSVNMTLRSVGLLAEGMDADLIIQVRKRESVQLCPNYVHPSDAARTCFTPAATEVHARIYEVKQSFAFGTGTMPSYTLKMADREHA